MADLPDVRDGLTRAERVVLYTLHECQKEFGDRRVPTALLYGRVCEKLSISKREFMGILQRLMGRAS